MWILKYKDEIIFRSWDHEKIEYIIRMMQDLCIPVSYEWVPTEQPIVDIYV